MESLKFCYDKTLLPAKSRLNTLKAVWQKSKYWPKGKSIKVYLINGTADEHKEMKQALSEIENHSSLKFVYTTNREESEIRVSFNKGWGSYSYLGTDALFIPKTEETINIGWRGVDVCRHEALHAVGALHEHQNPIKGINWNESRVIQDLSGAPNYWSEEQIRFNVLDKIDKTKVDASEFDSQSIMLYYFPSSWTLDGTSSNENHNFSQRDIEFMHKIYDITEQDTIAPVITLNGDSHITLSVGEDYTERGAEAFDNRDGKVEVTIKLDVDMQERGLHYVTYSAIDRAGNKSQVIRTIQVIEEFDMKEFLKELFPTKYRLEDLVESQVVLIANRLGLDASEEDLRQDTVNKVWNELNS